MFDTTTVSVTAAATPVTPPAGSADSRNGPAFSFTVPSTPAVRAGGPDVTWATGKPLPAGGEFSSRSRDTLYLICDTGQSVDITVLWEGVR